jgi:hypothetical protein
MFGHTLRSLVLGTALVHLSVISHYNRTFCTVFQVLVEASGPELLPLLPTIVDVAPAALPLLASAVSIPAAAFPVLGLGLLAASVGAVSVIPDDSVVNVALQTILVGSTFAAAVAAFAAGAILGQLTK